MIPADELVSARSTWHNPTRPDLPSDGGCALAGNVLRRGITAARVRAPLSHFAKCERGSAYLQVGASVAAGLIRSCARDVLCRAAENVDNRCASL
jgi:hypothetical protein